MILVTNKKKPTNQANRIKKKPSKDHTYKNKNRNLFLSYGKINKKLERFDDDIIIFNTQNIIIICEPQKYGEKS